MKMFFPLLCLLAMSMAEPPVGDGYPSSRSFHDHDHEEHHHSDFTRSPSEEYGPPGIQSRNTISSEYGPPNSRTGTEYDGPDARTLSTEYGPPNSRSSDPSTEYGVPNARDGLSEKYGLPNTRSGISTEYGAPSSRTGLSDVYGPPARISSRQKNFVPPAARTSFSQTFGSSKSQAKGLSQKYGAPNASARSGVSQQYGAPNARSGISQEYGVPKARSSLSQEYSVPNARSGISQEYGVPNARSAPSNEYGIPEAYSVPSEEYGTPNELTRNAQGSGSLSQEYGAPEISARSLSTQYGVPDARSTPSEEYGAPAVARSGKTGSVSFRKTQAASRSQKPARSNEISFRNQKTKSRDFNSYTQARKSSTGSYSADDSYMPNAKELSQEYSAPGLKTAAVASSYPSARSSPSSVYGAPSARMPSEQYGVPDTYDGASQGYNYGRAGEDNQEPANYDFAYKVNDFESGSDFGHAETRQENHAEGSYFVLLPDGTKQTVEYEADEDGFKPRISVEQVESGYDENAANVKSGPY